MKRFWFWFLIIVAILFTFIFTGYILISALFDTEPYIPDNSYLSINLGGSIPEYVPGDVLQEQLSGSVMDMRKFRQSLKMAAVDERIIGIVLKISYVSCGYAKLQEINALISEFKESNKKILAVLDVGLIRDYYIATACDSIFLQPEGMLLLTGVAAEVTFYKDLFKKVGIEADFEHVGKYKSYPEMYTRQTMSEAQKEVINNILDYRYQEIINTISHSRNLNRKDVNNFINEISGFIPEEALQYNLIDGIAYYDEILEKLSEDNDDPYRISAMEYSRISSSSLGLSGGARIAVIYCTGSIMGGEDGADPVFGTTVGASRVIRNLKAAARNSSVKAIILRIDSPGGSGLASEQIWHEVLQARKKKPVIASISDVGASGGYFIAIGADTVLAQPASLIGSIGVFIGKFSLSGLYEKIGLNVESLQRGKNAKMFSLNSKFSDTERKVVRKLIEDYYDKFVQTVSEARNKSFEEINQVAQGRVWNGLDGMKLGLIDTLGGLDDAIELAKNLAGLSADKKVRLIYYPKSRSLFQSIARYLYVLDNPIDKIKAYLLNIQSKPMSLMPFLIEFQ